MDVDGTVQSKRGGLRRWRKEKRCCVEVGVSLVFALLSRARAEASSACPTLAGICCHSPLPGASERWCNCRCRCRCSAASRPRPRPPPRPAGGTHASHRTHRRPPPPPPPPAAHRHRPSPIAHLDRPRGATQWQWRAGTLRKASRGPSTHSAAARGHHAHAQHDAACSPRRRAAFPLPP